MAQHRRSNNLQITVSDASALIGLSERTVINYIKAKEIAAVKVGKIWYIQTASVHGFMQKYGLGDCKQTEQEPDTRFIGTENDERDQTEPTRSLHSNNLRSKKATEQCGLLRLRCFQLCKIAFEMPMWISNDIADIALKERLITLKHRALESLGAGYFSFRSTSKSRHYEISREAIGAILANLYAQNEAFRACWNVEIVYIEQQLLPAYSSLIRKIEKRQTAGNLK